MNNPIRSILINANTEDPYLRGKTTVGGVQSLVVSGIESGVDLLVACADGATLAIAYVSANSLLHLIRTQGLVTRCAHMHIHPWRYLLIRDALAPDTQGRTVHDGRATGWSWASVQGALLSVQELGCGILTIRNESYLDETIVTLAKRDRSIRRLSPPRETLWATPAEQLLTSLPGIGPETADALLTATRGHAGWALHTLTCDDGAELPGITPAKRAKIRLALGLSADEYLTIHNESDTDDERHPELLAGAATA